MNDLISRQAAIDAIDKYSVWVMYTQGDSQEDEAEFVERIIKQTKKAIQSMLIEDLPSAQPEIICCKDCRHFVRDDIEEHTPYGFYNTYFHAYCDKHFNREEGEFIDVCLDDYCSFAERRTDE